ncbi:MAG: GNAT family N-acetyltransferase, partial [Sulfitobacter sp.]|nr:GNAT family N-acetyltransferase [Sulfitobacter sp.]
MDWLEDEHVTRYLSDSRHVSRFIEQVVGRVQLPILTHLFNQGGRFFMAYDRDDVPVGFVRLVKTGRDCEMVLVIGNRENWGRKLGASAIREGMKLAFFDMRAEKLIARIHADNARSRKAFERCGFLLETQTPALHSLAMTSERYLRLLRENPAEHVTHIHITEIDKARLRNMLAFEEPSGIFELEHEIERAIVVDPLAVASDVVTMNSKAVVQLDDEAMEVALVYPEDADDSAGKLSVFSDMGTAILGYKEGDTFAWRLRNRT